MKNVNKVYLSSFVGSNSRSCSSVSTDKVKGCLQSQEATSRAWTGLEQNIMDTAVNEWRKRLFALLFA